MATPELIAECGKLYATDEFRSATDLQVNIFRSRVLNKKISKEERGDSDLGINVPGQFDGTFKENHLSKYFESLLDQQIDRKNYSYNNDTASSLVNVGSAANVKRCIEGVTEEGGLAMHGRFTKSGCTVYLDDAPMPGKHPVSIAATVRGNYKPTNYESDDLGRFELGLMPEGAMPGEILFEYTGDDKDNRDILLALTTKYRPNGENETWELEPGNELFEQPSGLDLNYIPKFSVIWYDFVRTGELLITSNAGEHMDHHSVVHGVAAGGGWSGEVNPGRIGLYLIRDDPYLIGPSRTWDGIAATQMKLSLVRVAENRMSFEVQGVATGQRDSGLRSLQTVGWVETYPVVMADDRPASLNHPQEILTLMDSKFGKEWTSTALY